MAQFFFRITLHHIDSTSARSRQKNMGELTKYETDNIKDARKEIERIKDMTSRASWQLPTKLVVERAEMTEYVAVDVDTLEPLPSNINVASDEILPLDGSQA